MVSDIPAGDGKNDNLFTVYPLFCSSRSTHQTPCIQRGDSSLYFPLLSTQKYLLSRVAAHSPCPIEQGLIIFFVTTGPWEFIHDTTPFLLSAIEYSLMDCLTLSASSMIARLQRVLNDLQYRGPCSRSCDFAPPPLSFQSVKPATHTMTKKERQLAEVRGGEGGAESCERLVLFKSFNTLWGGGGETWRKHS